MVVDCRPLHVNNVVRELRNFNFSATFGDIRLVFSGGEVVPYFKGLLSLLSRDWKHLLQILPDTELVLLPQFSVVDFFQEELEGFLKESCNDMHDDIKVKEKKETQNNQVDQTKTVPVEALEKKEIIFPDSLTDPNEIIETKENIERILSYKDFVALGKEEDPSPCPLVDLSGHPGCVYLPGILPDFQWPAHLAGPPCHTLGWRKSPGKAGDVTSGRTVTVRGNRSISRVLEEARALGQQAAFLLQPQGQEDQLVGVLHLSQFADGQAASSCPAFQVQGREDWLSLEQLLSLGGYSPGRVFGLGDPCYREQPGGSNMASKVLIYMGDKMTNVRDLTDQWKQVLLQDLKMIKKEEELSLEQTKQGAKPSQVLDWLRTQCVKTIDNATICLYCGFICYEQSFTTHMKIHIFRKVKIFKGRIKKRWHCTECSKSWLEYKRLKFHMITAHDLVPEEKVNLKECEYCHEMIPEKDINKHSSELHLNEKINCKDCETTCLNTRLLKMHIANVHKNKDKYKGNCTICQKEVTNLPKHMSNSHRTVECNHCNKKYRSPDALKEHMHSVNGTKPKRQCQDCFKFVINLSYHNQTVHNGKRKPSKRNSKICQVCKKLVLKAEYDSHRQLCRPHTCSICSKSVHNLEQHLLSIHSEGLKCGICAETFGTKTGHTIKGQLRDHIYESHMKDIFLELGINEDIRTEDMKAREDIAQYLVDRKSSQKGNAHTCGLCLTEFNTRTRMFNHMKYHLKYLVVRLKQVPWPCTECGNMINRKNMQDHVCLEPQKLPVATKTKRSKPTTNNLSVAIKTQPKDTQSKLKESQKAKDSEVGAIEKPLANQHNYKNIEASTRNVT